MKQLPLTEDLKAKIRNNVGPDIDVDGLAVFEAIAINTKPLPGKRGSIFERAVVTQLTLQQMADSINGGNHLPLVSDHFMGDEPKGRVFFAEVLASDNGHHELRVLFYLDATEEKTVSKLNAGSLDEVSVSFLASQMLCSECNFDYFGADSTGENIWSRMCANGHSVGEDGVHVRLVGLSQFSELSLVARGAADNAKIVGKSESKLQPATRMRLAARGFEVDGLFCRASQGEDVVSFDPNKLVADLAQSQAQVITLTASQTAKDTEIASLKASQEAATSQVAELTAQVTQLSADLEAARAAPNNQADYEAALSFMTEVYSKILTASGAEAPAEMPKTVAELKAAIEEKTANLTAILPVGGVSIGAKSDEKPAAPLIASAFSNRLK